MDPLSIAYMSFGFNLGAHVFAVIYYFLTGQNDKRVDIGKGKQVRIFNLVYGVYCILLLLLSVTASGVAALFGALLACVIGIFIMGSLQADGL